MGILTVSFLFALTLLAPRLELAIENLALRQQMAVLQQSNRRPKLRPRDRVLWSGLRRWWPNWKA